MPWQRNQMDTLAFWLPLQLLFLPNLLGKVSQRRSKGHCLKKFEGCSVIILSLSASDTFKFRTLGFINKKLNSKRRHEYDILFSGKLAIIRHTIGDSQNYLATAWPSSFPCIFWKLKTSASFEKFHWFFSLLHSLGESIDRRLQSGRKSED